MLVELCLWGQCLDIRPSMPNDHNELGAHMHSSGTLIHKVRPAGEQCSNVNPDA